MTEDTNLAMYQANSYPIYVVIDRDGNIPASNVVLRENEPCAGCCVKPAWGRRSRLGVSS
jgi:hypothetical protein